MVVDARASGRRDIAIGVVWAAMPLTVAVYALLRYLAPGNVTLVMSQVVFLAPPWLAFLFCGAAAYAGPKGNRERYAWSFLCAACGFLAIVESYYAFLLLTSGARASSPGVVFDLASAAAVVCFISYLAVSVSLEGIGLRRVVRHVLDSIAMVALAFTVMHHLWTVGGGATGTGLASPMRLSGYALIGIVILLAQLALLWASGPEGRRPWDLVVAAGIAVFSFGLLLWPLWGLAMSGHLPKGWYSAITDLLFLCGYYLIFVAGLYRTLYAQSVWRERTVYPQTPAKAWPGVATSTMVLLAVVVQVVLVASAVTGSDDARVDLAGLLISTTCLVLRTALATAETVELKDRSVTDGATGAFNMREFDVRFAERLLTQRRFGEPFALFAVDLDRFSALNSSSSPAVAGAVLTHVVRAMSETHVDADVFRQAGDEFLVLTSAADAREAALIGESLLAAIRSLDSAWDAPSASIGFAMCPEHACERDEMLRMASGARAWVKHHGRGRVMCYDERLVRPFGLEDRLKLIDERARRDMTRALSAATDARDPVNARHSRNVAALSTLLAQDCGFSEEELRAIEVAAMLHDVGKIALPDPMLGGKTLSIRERIRSREHSELGERLLASVGIDGVPEWVRSHHERWDGEGYPDGLSGEEIPLAARIIALADAYDGMTMGVRYGAPMSKAAALQEIDLGLGTRFDPELGERFIALVGRTAALGWSNDWPTV